MHPLISFAVGLVVAWAVKRRNGTEDVLGESGAWRLAAGAAGALVPYLEILFWLGGAGVYYQAERGLLWSFLLLPLLAFITAGVLASISKRGWGNFYWPVLASMLSTLLLGLLTSDGIQPLALLVKVRVGLGVAYDFDGVILGLCVLTLGMGYAFRFWRRDIARLGLGCVLVYLLALSGLHFSAWRFGSQYADAMGLRDGDGEVNVDALPQPLSPFNWRVVVTENPDQGGTRLHDTLINLKRSGESRARLGSLRAQRVAALYHPREQAVWRVYPHFGGDSLSAAEQRRVKLAWYGWNAGPFGGLARYAIFDEAVKPPVRGIDTSCLKFVDLRFDGARDADKGTYVLCPSATGGVRVFIPYAIWPFAQGYRELVPVAGVRG